MEEGILLSLRLLLVEKFSKEACRQSIVAAGRLRGPQAACCRDAFQGQRVWLEGLY